MSSFGKIALLLLLCATTIAGFLVLPPAVGFRNPALARIVVFHVPCPITAYVITGVGTWYAVRYLLWRRMIDDIKSRTAFALGLVFWGLTLVTGAIFAKAQWGAYWNWDIKQGCMLMLFLVFAAYFALRAAIDDPRRQATLGAAYAIFSLLAAPYLTNVLPNSTPQTLHPKGTLEGGLSLDYTLVLWGEALGLILTFVWAWRIQVAAETLLAQRLRRPLEN